jgi:HEAT repeat protein
LFQPKEIALICLGEIGRSSDLSSFSNLIDVVFQMLTSPNEQIKWAASYALGNITVGNSEKQLPKLLRMISENSVEVYLLLNSLKEVLVREKGDVLMLHMNNITPILYENMESKDDGIRSVVSECIGRLATHNPEQMIPELLEKTRSPKSLVRASVVASLKHVTFHQSKSALWKSNIPQFVNLMTDVDIVGFYSSLALPLSFVT